MGLKIVFYILHFCRSPQAASLTIKTSKQTSSKYSTVITAVDRKTHKLNIMGCYDKILELPCAKKILTYSSRAGITGAAGEEQVLSRSNGSEKNAVILKEC